MKALVLGGTGFIGQAACKELMRRGIETIAASRTPHPYGTFTSHVAFDRTDAEELKRVLETVRPEVLLDLACYQPAEVSAVIRDFRGTRYVFASTGVYPDSTTGEPAREEDFRPLDGEPPAGPLPYLEGKRWCETVLQRSRDFPWVIVRPPAVMGAADHTLRIAAYIQRVEDGAPLLVPEETYQRRLGLAWVRDIGYACALVCELHREVERQAFNVAFDNVSLKSLIEGIGRAVGSTPNVVPLPFADLPDGASPYGPDPKRPGGYDIDKARTQLGFEPSELEDALAETMAWYRVRKPSHPGYANRARELELARTRT